MATSATPTQILAVLLLLTGHVAGDWITSGQYQYLISNDEVYWDNGLSFCTQQKQTAFLARPTTENAEFLKSFGSADLYWADHRYIGLGWVWSDGSPLPAHDVQWHSGYPKSPATNGLGLYERSSATLMNSEPNFYKFPVVCQAPLDPTTPGPTTTTPKPTTTKPEPTTTTPEPTTITSQPTTITPEPTTSAPEPTTITSQPTTTTPEPNTITPEPTTPAPEPTSAATTASPVICPSEDGWEDLGTGDGRCYYLSVEDPTAANLTWTDANQACVNNNAILASVPDPLTFYALSFRVSAAGEDAWTGLLNIPGLEPMWADGSEFNTDLDQFIVDGTEPYGYLSSADGNMQLAGTTDTKAFICYTDSLTPAPSPSPAPTASPCPAGWEMEARNNTCYLFSEEQQYWTAAGHRCHEFGANLVSIHDQTLINFLLLNAGDDVYWTGLQNQGEVYVWQDGSSTSTTDIALLKPYLDQGEQGKDCVAMDKSVFPLFLVHDDCFTERRFVCQKPAV